MPDKPESVSQIVDRLASLGREQEEVSIGQVIESFGSRSYGPSIFVPALIGISPIGAVPGVPALFALLIAIFAIQIMIGRSHLWLPDFVGERRFSGAKFEQARNKLKGLAQWLDRIFHGRLVWAIKPPFVQIAAPFILALCLFIVPLELVPFAAAIPFAAIAAFGLALTVRDGVLMLLAIAVSCASFGFAFRTLLN